MGEDKDAFVNSLAMQTLTLLDENEDSSDTKSNGKDAKTDKETSNHIAYDETNDTTSGGSSGPVDITALQSHQLQRPLKPLENLAVKMSGVVHHSPPMPKNRGRAWAAAIRKMQAPTSIMMLFLTSCSSLFILMYTLIAPTTATTPAMA